MFTTYIQIGHSSLGNFYAIAHNEDKKVAIKETISRANEIFTDEFIAAKKPYKVVVRYPNGGRKSLTVNKQSLEQ